MRRPWKRYLLALSLALGITSTAFGQGGTFTTLDFPGASSTLAWSINKSGDIAGLYTIAGVSHGFIMHGFQAKRNRDIRRGVKRKPALGRALRK